MSEVHRKEPHPHSTLRLKLGDSTTHKKKKKRGNFGAHTQEYMSEVHRKEPHPHSTLQSNLGEKTTHKKKRKKRALWQQTRNEGLLSTVQAHDKIADLAKFNTHNSLPH